MLYSILVAIICYHTIRFLIVALATSSIIDGIMITLGILCFTVFYLVRRKNKRLSKILLAIGIAITTVLLAFWFVHPIVPSKTWTTFLAVLAGLALYIATRRMLIRRFVPKDKEPDQLAPPFRWKWSRRLLLVLL